MTASAHASVPFQIRRGVTVVTQLSVCLTVLFFYPASLSSTALLSAKGGSLVVSEEGSLKDQLVHITFNTMLSFYCSILLSVIAVNTGLFMN